MRPTYVGIAPSGAWVASRGQIQWLPEDGDFTGYTEVDLLPGEYHELHFFHHPSDPRPSFAAVLDHPLRHSGGLKSIGPIRFLGDLIIAEVRA